MNDSQEEVQDHEANANNNEEGSSSNELDPPDTQIAVAQFLEIPDEILIFMQSVSNYENYHVPHYAAESVGCPCGQDCAISGMTLPQSSNVRYMELVYNFENFLNGDIEVLQSLASTPSLYQEWQQSSNAVQLLAFYASRHLALLDFQEVFIIQNILQNEYQEAFFATLFSSILHIYGDWN